MSIVVFKTESTDLLKTDRPLSDGSQPRLVQIAAILLTPQWEEVNAFSVKIRPQNWIMKEGAAKTHGITMRRLDLYGIRANVALAMFMDFVRCASEIAAYNYEFDAAIVQIELLRHGARPDEWRRGGLRRTSVMELASQKWKDGRPIKFRDAYDLATGDGKADFSHHGIDDCRAIARVLRAVR